MTNIIHFDEDVVESGFLCPDCGSQLWDTSANEPGEALGTDVNNPHELYCIACGAHIGTVIDQKPGTITYKVNCIETVSA